MKCPSDVDPTPTGAAEPALPEPFGYVMEWPAPGGGGEELIFSRTDAAGKAIGCRIRPVFVDYQIRASRAEGERELRAKLEALEKAYEVAAGVYGNLQRAADDTANQLMAARAELEAIRAANPVAWTARGKDGLPKFGRGWIFSKVSNDTANMPLYPGPVAAAGPAPLTPERIEAIWQDCSDPDQPDMSIHRFAEAAQRAVKKSLTVAEPLTKTQIDFILGDSFLAANGSVYSTRIYDFVQAIERAHGITGPASTPGDAA